MQEVRKNNPLGTEKINKLMMKFAVPSIVAMLVSALYNIVDQLFIGQKVGTLGNAATNVSFPLAILCTSLALLFGIGGASAFNLAMGKGEEESAPYIVGNAITMLLGSGVLLFLITELNLSPLLRLFGSPGDVLPYAKTYVSITAIGFPFLILTTGGGHLIRADGSPKMTMICNLSGALLNVVLDALFVLVFEWGMAGAAVATIIGQIFSGFLAISYLRRYQTVTVTKKHMVPHWKHLKRIMSLGAASCFNQISMMLVQIFMNNSLKYYGSLSVYGESIPMACVGIVTKVNQVFFAIIIGIAQGTQPIESYNYGAGNYKRVKAAYLYATTVGGILSLGAFLLFQLLPRQLLSLFGSGTIEYFTFGIKTFRIFLFATFINFMQPITTTFFTSIGKAYKGIFLSLTRQILFLLPLMFLVPLAMGIDGILYAGPIADFLAFGITILMVIVEFRKITRLELSMKDSIKTSY